MGYQEILYNSEEKAVLEYTCKSSRVLGACKNSWFAENCIFLGKSLLVMGNSSRIVQNNPDNKTGGLSKTAYKLDLYLFRFQAKQK